MSKSMKKIITWISNALLIIFIIVGVIMAISMMPGKTFFRVLSVKSGSMEPTIHTGSIIFVRPAEEYKIGDIISFKPDAQKTNLENVTHRLFAIEGPDSNKDYVTRGDANDAPDGDKIVKSQIVGKMVFKIPYLGFLIGVLRTLPGLILLILIPSLIIIYEEVNNIKHETKKVIAKRRTRLVNGGKEEDESV